MRWTLLAVLVLAGILRLGWPEISPPGISSDEASNAWNAYCLLKTGRDEHGVRWPIFYTAAFDDYRSPLYLYLLLPFQAAWGMSPHTTRLPAEVGGVVSVGLIFLLGKRLFDPATGLAAALLLAVNPWHILDSRWGHEGCISPLLILLGLVALAWSVPDFGSSPGARPKIRPARAVFAGLILGFACFGYAAIRLYLPILFGAVLLVLWPIWRRSTLLLVTGFAVPVGILAWKHLTDPAMNFRANEIRLWKSWDPILIRVVDVLQQYAYHFDPRLLFTGSRGLQTLMPREGCGLLYWLELPLILAGLAIAASHCGRSVAARWLLAGFLLYPAGDCLNGVLGQPHPLRSICGLWAIELMAAVGAVEVWRWLAKTYGAALARACATLGLLILAASAGVFCDRYFGPYNQDAETRRAQHVAIQDVCIWLKPRLAQADAVFWGPSEFPFVYAPICVYLDMDPRDWFAHRPIYRSGSDPNHPNYVARFGKMNLEFFPELARQRIDELRQSHRLSSALFVVRPEDLPSAYPGPVPPPLFVAKDPSGHPALLVFGGPAD